LESAVTASTADFDLSVYVPFRPRAGHDAVELLI
jgi:hypothetical protein